jgi:CRP-like cAMP-binding protein
MASANRLLAALPSDEFVRIAPELEVVELRRRDTTWSTGEDVRHVYFPESGAVALVASAAAGPVLETGLVGQEGLVGVELFFGSTTAFASALVLLPGVAQRLPAGAFNRLCVPGTPFYESVRRYGGARLATISQSALCDATHSIHHRCVRRLLALHDAARTDYFPITQQVLATLLGVRRASVSVAAEKLQDARLIRYEHGRMHVVDRAGLEQAACGCYKQMRAHTQNLFVPADA